MMSPHHLHAVSAAWSLAAARGRLAELARLEAASNGRALLDAAPCLRSTSAYGTRHSTGGHGDPTVSTLTARPIPATWWSDLTHRLDQRVRWTADRIAPGPGDPLTRLITRIPAMLPATAAVVARHLADEDTWVRAAIALPPAQHPLIGIGCPSCGQRSLHVQSAGPQEAWTVVCTAGCVCTGQGCPCDMPGAVEGAQHIWPRDVVLGAVAGAAPAA